MTAYNEMPQGLSPKGQKAYHAIMKVLRKYDMLDTGGCKTFYSPQHWKERGEEYGTESELIVVYDGGDVGPFFDYAYGVESLQAAMEEALHAVGCWAEPCTCWYSAIYED